jgi:hypothetical protein
MTTIALDGHPDTQPLFNGMQRIQTPRLFRAAYQVGFRAQLDQAIKQTAL